MHFRQIRRVILVAAGVSISGVESPAQGQDLEQAGIGYVVNGPEQFAGGSIHALWDLAGGLGLYVDAKRGLGSLVDDRTFTTDFDFRAARDEFGDDLVLEDSEWTSVNVALMRPITAELIGYAGAGHSRERAYGEFFNQAEERGVGGFYWVENHEGSGTRLNLLGGVFFQIGTRVSVHLGVESAPAGLTVGGSYLFRSRMR